MVTYCVDQLAPSRDAWVQHLGYCIAEEGSVDEAVAASWQAPAMAGLPCCLLQPASGESFWIRYIETGERRGFESSATRGWTATELLVADVDQLAERLQQSPFTRLAGPGDLFPGPKAPRAMQATGPAGELLYFTRLLPGGSRYGLKQARCPVDRAFIVTVAGDSTPAMSEFYARTLGMRVMEPMPFINGILAHSCGAPPDTVFPTTVIPLPGRRYLVELDEFPAGLPPRPTRSGLLPPGMAMASFRVDQLERHRDRQLATHASCSALPYHGRRSAVIRGAADELLELIEGPAE
jgi:catechol 2,3-dioxygenase-like lactoylglutathione lyase family enzyme